jgi:hypothetical protein
MQKRNKAARMMKAINPEDPIFIVAVSPALIDEIATGCQKVEGLCDQYMELLGAR